MTNEELLSVAEIVERATNRLHRQAADHETKMAEHRASFGARTEADAKLIAGLREELEQIDRLVNPDREESTVIVVKRMLDLHRLIAREYDKAVSLCETEEQTPEQCIVSLNARIDRLQDDARDYYKDREVIRQINLDLRAEIAALQERLRASIARGDLAQIEVAALKSQTPKHPVKVGGWLRRKDSCYDDAPYGYMASVLGIQSVGMDYTYTIIDQSGNRVSWNSAYCEPCDPPNHDTEAGKAAAERAAKTEPVEIKVGDLVEVVSNRGSNTWFSDVGSFGTVTSVEEINDSILVNLDNVPGKKNALAGYVSFCDVRKVTT